MPIADIQRRVFVDPRDLGALGDGTSEAGLLQAALNAAGEGGTVVLAKPISYYNLGTTGITVPSGVSLISAGGRSIPIRVSNGFAGVAVTVEDATLSRVRGLHIAPEAGATLINTSTALAAYGTSGDIELSDIDVGTGFGSGIEIAGGGGTALAAERTMVRAYLRDCRVRGTTSNFGFAWDECEVIYLENCHAWECALDGFKARKNNLFTIMVGGSSLRNGQRSNPGSSLYDGNEGDGLDAYSGGRYLVIRGTVFAHNFGHGITYKDDEFHDSTSATYANGDIYGYQRSTSIDAICVGNRAVGCGIYRNDVAADPDPTIKALPPYATVSGIFDGNGSSGLWINSLHVNGHGIQANENGVRGVYVADSAYGVDLFGPICCGNGLHNRAQTVTCSGAASTHGETGDHLLPLEELTESIAAGTVLTFSGGSVTTTVFAPKGATGVVTTALGSGIGIGQTASITAGKLTDGEGTGMQIRGQHVRVWGGKYWGISSDKMGDPTGTTDIDGNTPVVMHSAPIQVIDGRDVELHLNAQDLRFATATNRVSVSGASERVIMHIVADSAPNGAAGQACSPGSTYVNTSAGSEAGLRWVKLAGAADSTDGWRFGTPVRLTASVGTSSTAIAHGLGYTPTSVTVLPRADARVWRSAVADATNIYLQASVTVTCDIQVA